MAHNLSTNAPSARSPLCSAGFWPVAVPELGVQFVCLWDALPSLCFPMIQVPGPERGFKYKPVSRHLRGSASGLWFWVAT